LNQFTCSLQTVGILIEKGFLLKELNIVVISVKAAKLANVAVKNLEVVNDAFSL